MPDDWQPMNIEVERVPPSDPADPYDPNDADDELEAIDTAVRRLLTQDEARIISIVSLVLMAIGSVFSAAWFFMAWRVEHELDSSNTVLGGGGSPDLLDRVIALLQIGGILSLFLLVLATGCGLRLFASRVVTDAASAD